MLKTLLTVKRPLRYLIFSGLVLGILLSLIDLRTLIFYADKNNKGHFNYFEVVCYNFGFSYLIHLILAIPYFLIYRFLEIGSKSILIFVGFLMVLIDFGLNEYFVKTKLSLGSDIFGFSISDLVAIVNKSASFDLFSLIPIILAPTIYIFILLNNRLLNLTKPPFSIIAVASLIYISFNLLKPVTRIAYFLKDCVKFIETTELKTAKWEDSNKFPLLQKRTFENDVLSTNMNLGEKKPNIVLLVIEGLGSDFMGEKAQYEGFTPYLDSLSKQSLYWSNFMSNAGRSFGAIPSILGSVPFGETGFMEIEKTPDHVSLVTILKNNDYTTSYIEGTDSEFDRKIHYLQHEGMEVILDKENFGPEYTPTKSSEGGFSWGYPDSEIYRKFMAQRKKTIKPKLEVIFTISNHEPFIYPDQENYRKKVIKIVAEGKRKYDEDVMEEHRDVFGSLLYSDDAIRNFIETYKKDPEYANTIFMITGDHRLIPVPMKDQICRFHVPMIVYSPMLKKPQEFKGLSSHMDIMPSVAAMIKNKYKGAIPDNLPWVGNGLSSSIKFGGDKQIPLMKYKGSFSDFIDGDSYYSDGDLYQIQDHLELANSGDYEKLNAAKEKYDRFRKINAYVTDKNMIVPKNLVFTKSYERVFTVVEQKRLNELMKGETNTNTLFLNARQLAFNKKRVDALLLCDYIMVKKPRNFEVANLKGRIYSWEGRYDLAEKVFNETLEKSQTSSDTYLALLNLYFWSDQPQKAYKLYEKAKVNIYDNKTVMAELSATIQKIKNSSAK